MALAPAAPAASAFAAPQSALQAQGEQAAQILDLTRVLFIGGGAIFLAVMLLGWLALRGPAGAREGLAHRGWIVGGGIAFPVLVLTGLLVYSFQRGFAAPAAQPAAAARIEVTGELWWWRVRYLDAAGQALFESANELRIPVGLPVDVALKSDNVIHSFWVPSLAGKLDTIPGRVNRLRLRAQVPGVTRGQCAEFCGAQHARMALHVVAMQEAPWRAWLAAQAQPAAVAGPGELAQGRAVFERSRCGVCHTVRGTPAQGRLAPDLTHFGSRIAIAAGTLPNTQGAIAGWIAGTQHLKPGSLMPAYQGLAGEDLRSLSAWLESLR
jgi:cytochrome c oxidase subunit 2